MKDTIYGILAIPFCLLYLVYVFVFVKLLLSEPRCTKCGSTDTIDEGYGLYCANLKCGKGIIRY